MTCPVAFSALAQAVKGADDARLASTNTATKQDVDVFDRNAFLLRIKFCQLLPEALRTLKYRRGAAYLVEAPLLQYNKCLNHSHIARNTNLVCPGDARQPRILELSFGWVKFADLQNLQLKVLVVLCTWYIN